MSSLVTAALARAQAFLLEPAPARPSSQSTPAAAAGGLPSLEVAVVGLTPGCGSSTVARGLAMALGVPGARTAHLIAVTAGGTESMVEHARTVGQLAAQPVAIVWDLEPTELQRAGQIVAESDAVLLVAGDRSEPALAELVSRMLSERFGAVHLVATRVAEPARWEGRAIACVPQSRLGAVLLARGRRPAGELGTALTTIAAALEEGIS